MNYYFVTSAQQKFSSFQEAMAPLGECFMVEELSQLSQVLPAKESREVFFIHLIEPLKAVDEFVKEIRKLSKNSVIIHVTQDDKFDTASHQKSAAAADAYVDVKSTIGMMRATLKSLGLEAQRGVAGSLDKEFLNMDDLARLSNHPFSREIDSVFRLSQPLKPLPELSGDLMSSRDAKKSSEDLSLLSDLDEMSLSDESLSESSPDLPTEDDDAGMDLMLSDDLVSDTDEESLGDDDADSGTGEENDEEGLELSLSDEMESYSLEEAPLENIGELDFSDTPDLPLGDGPLSTGLSLADDVPASEGIDLSASDDAIGDVSVDFGAADAMSDDSDLSEDAKRKLREIDEIMENSSSQINIHANLGAKNSGDDDSSPNMDKPLVSDDLNLDDLDFSQDLEEEKPKQKKKAKEKEKEKEREELPSRESVSASNRAMSSDLKEISGAYTAEMERSFATISNLRADREELLAKIQNMEEDKVLHNRQSLTLRAELDEKKIELSIVRKKSNDEISDLKDRMKFHDERRLILEEKTAFSPLKLEKSSQRNKMDVKKVQMRERELEQKLELLKSDAETQIRHRDLKILELKRKIDAMEFDMESIQVQEKKSVESRFELEDKLDKAIKTLRSAITVLEEESDRESAVQALKKNIDV